MDSTDSEANFHSWKRNQTQIPKSQRKHPCKSGDADIKEWNVAISSYMRNGRCNEALRVFERMPRWSSVSYNAMISGYLRNGEFESARKLFDEMPERDLVSWNVMIKGYVRNRNLGKARELFESMPERDVCSWTTILSGYAQSECVDEARRVFDRMPERDVVSWNTIISGYAQNGDIVKARKLFDESPAQDVFTWTAMVSGYVQNGMVEEARELFDKMPERNEVSWNAMIAGYVQDERMELAKELFDIMPFRNVSTWNTMITGYAQCGDVSEAKKLFDKMPKRDPVSWAAMIAGYSQCGHGYEALRLFVQVEREGGRLNRFSFSSALITCADVVALELGKQLHGRLVKGGYETRCFVGNALLSMYCKCGSIEEAYDLFEEMTGKDIFSWNTMIAGYSRHGFGEEALRFFESMKREGLKPDDATLVAVLTACSHTGLVDKGRQYFYTMTQDFGVTPNSQHYACMVDLLGRAGLLEEAHNLMKNMPFEPDGAMWKTLLSASKLRKRMLNQGVKIFKGYSWIEIQNKTHTFYVGGEFHPEKDEIYAFLEDLHLRMKKAGYVSKTSVVPHDVEEEEKECMVQYHSERLAVAYGIMRVSSGKPIRVMKNLRVCEDCHSAIKCMAKITGRLIILRDKKRFHHFKDGSCSCGDYW
ncbi:hypothetical protein EUTSA_v10011306mg [Eutrema salsugineum]|uniref:DYW domain-containing protein n=1 Tax=Eutrema salsugineum TaxID=72664 RepID=V4KL60_EUTSA|nr:hypothetical protein EUTSA_v10011306mg [Eutrema salsugineum]